MSKGQHKPNLYKMQPFDCCLVFSCGVGWGLLKKKLLEGGLAIQLDAEIWFIESIFGHLFVLRHDRSAPQSSANHECAFVWHVEPFISL